MINNFAYFSRLYNENKFFELTSSPRGLYFLKLRSLARKEYYLRLFTKTPISADALKVSQYIETLFNSQIPVETINETINEIYE